MNFCAQFIFVEILADESCPPGLRPSTDMWAESIAGLDAGSTTTSVLTPPLPPPLRVEQFHQAQTHTLSLCSSRSTVPLHLPLLLFVCTKDTETPPSLCFSPRAPLRRNLPPPSTSARSPAPGASSRCHKATRAFS